MDIFPSPPDLTLLAHCISKHIQCVTLCQKKKSPKKPKKPQTMTCAKSMIPALKGE